MRAFAIVAGLLASAAVVGNASGQGTKGASPPQPSRQAAPSEAGQAKAPPKDVPSTKTTPIKPEQKIETLEEIVARVQRRLAREAPARSAKRPSAAVASPRVRLVWRASVVWPAELVEKSGSEDDRVTLSWDPALP